MYYEYYNSKSAIELLNDYIDFLNKMQPTLYTNLNINIENSKPKNDHKEEIKKYEKMIKHIKNRIKEINKTLAILQEHKDLFEISSFGFDNIENELKDTIYSYNKKLNKLRNKVKEYYEGIDCPFCNKKMGIKRKENSITAFCYNCNFEFTLIDTTDFEQLKEMVNRIKD